MITKKWFLCCSCGINIEVIVISCSKLWFCCHLSLPKSQTKVGWFSVQTRINKAIVTSHITSQLKCIKHHWTTIAQNAYCSRDIYLQYSENYRSRKLVAKRNSSGSHWSNITHAFLRREYCFARELVRAALRNKRWIVVILVLKHSW